MCLMLQCVAVRFSMLQCAAVCCSMWQCAVVCCSDGSHVVASQGKSLLRIYKALLVYSLGSFYSHWALLLYL